MAKRHIFVFGSNLAGRHGKGAAKTALQQHGAVYGQGVGLQGNSYAIPTKDRRLCTLPRFVTHDYVEEFLTFARANSGFIFDVTRIGCGLAGYSDAEIAPMFEQAPENCRLPKEWRAILDANESERI